MNNREIKFRAWQNNEMLNQRINGVYATRRFLEHLYEDTELMQYTGLKDKNGVEIYEGDVVSNKIIRGRVTFNHFCFGVYDKNDDFMMLARCFVDLEIIGNIYQNSELLNA